MYIRVQYGRPCIIPFCLSFFYPSSSVGTEADQLTNSVEVALPFKTICLCVSSWVGTVRHSGPMPECLLLCHSVPLSPPVSSCMHLYASHDLCLGGLRWGCVCAVPLRVWEWGHTYTHILLGPLFSHIPEEGILSSLTILTTMPLCTGEWDLRRRQIASSV